MFEMIIIDSVQKKNSLLESRLLFLSYLDSFRTESVIEALVARVQVQKLDFERRTFKEL